MASDGARTRDGSVPGAPARAIVIGLLAVRVLVVAVLVWRADAVVDEGLRRYDRVAASPVTPYRNFAVEWMPVQTALVHVVGGDGATATVALVATIAALADLAVAGAMTWGWGVRAAQAYLAFGLPLLAVAYTRLDLVAVALAAWAFAFARRGRDGPAGVTLGLAALSGTWGALLLPWAALKRRRPTLTATAITLGVGGAAWFVVGGPDGPMQVLTYRGATGWDVQSSVGGVLDAVTGAATYLEGGILRVGYAPGWARGLLLLGILGVAATVWGRWRPDREDPAAAPALAVAAAVLALSPTVPAAWVAILVPWAALAWERDRWAAGGAVAAIALTGALAAIAPPDDTTALTIAIVLARQVVLVLVAIAALTTPAETRPSTAAP